MFRPKPSLAKPVSCEASLDPIDDAIVGFIDAFQLRIDDSIKFALARLRSGRSVTVQLHKSFKDKSGRDERIAADIKDWELKLGTPMSRSGAQFLRR